MTQPHLADPGGATAAAPLDRTAPIAGGWRLSPRLVAVLLSILATVVRFAIDPVLGDRLPYVSFFVAVTVVAYVATPGATLLAIGLGFAAADWFFIPPRNSLAIPRGADQVGALAYFVVCGFIAALNQRTTRAKARAEAAAALLERRHEQLEAQIAERRRAEDALKESEARYRALIAGQEPAVLPVVAC